MEDAGGGGGMLSPHEIYKQVTGGPGTGSYGAATDASRIEAELEEQRADMIRRIAQKIEAGWQGSASEAAYGAATPLADAARDRAIKLRVARVLFDGHTQSFEHTKNSVVPVAQKPPESNIINDAIPWDTDLDREINDWQNDARQNIAVYGSYDNSSLSNEQQLPRDFPALTDPGASIAVSESGSAPSGGPRQSGPSSPLPGGGGPNSGIVPSSVTGPGPADGPGSVSAPPQPVGTSQPPQGTDTSGDTQPPGSPPGTRPPVVGPQPPVIQPPPGPVPPVGGLPVVPPGGRAPGFGPDGGRGGAGGGGPLGRGGAGVPEGAPGGRGAGAGGGPGARGGAVGEPGLGGRPGAGAGEDAAARRGGPGAAGARGAGGAGGFAPMGAGRGAGGEDEEHDRKYTIEPDPE